MTGYLTVENVQHNLSAFENALKVREGVSLEQLAHSLRYNPRRLLFETMKEIAQDPPITNSLKDLNNFTLKRFYGRCTKQQAVQPLSSSDDIDVFENEDLINQVLENLKQEPQPLSAPEAEASAPKMPAMKEETHYITISGYDRNWINYPLRYKYSIDTSDFLKSYKNISEMEITKLIISPRKDQLVTPYIVVKISELGVNTDGSNEANKTSFSTLVFDKKVDNAVIMRSIHDRESHVFTPPLAQLPKLSIELVRPNNFIYSHESDNARLWTLEYDDNNKECIRVVLTSFFPLEDFQVGHIVYFKNVTYPYYSSPTDPAAIEYDDHCVMYDRIMNFINRKEGHEIKLLSSSTKDKMIRSFLIECPGKLNSKTGKFDVDMEMVNRIKKTRDQSFDFQLSPTPIGALINGNVQPVISFKLKQIVPSHG